MSKIESDNLLKLRCSLLRKSGLLARSCNANLVWCNKHISIQNKVEIESVITPQTTCLRIHPTNTELTKGSYYEVVLTTTPCHFGGTRYWFVCPATYNQKPCCRRAEVLYKLGNYFACRHCHNLTYKSRNISGIEKKTGVCNFPEPSNLRTISYQGKATKKYRKYIQKLNKAIESYVRVSELFDLRANKIMSGKKGRNAYPKEL